MYCQARLPGKTARQDCWARLPEKTAGATTTTNQNVDWPGGILTYTRG
jgi:hypothetical protein